MGKINLVEILKDCPTGMGLDCTVYDNCTLEKVFGDGFLYPIQIQTPEGLMNLTKYGGLYKNTHSKCVIFPKGKTTWEGFVPPCKFNDGDVISNSLGTCIFKGEGRIKGTVNFYCGISDVYFNVKDDKCNPNGHYGDIVDYRLATEEEKQKLFDAIKANGYKWNSYTKTLEKLIEPKFKVGDVIQDIYTSKVRITEVNIEDERYGYESMVAKGIGSITFSEQNNWKLVLDVKPKFKVGDRIVKKNSACLPMFITKVNDGFYYSNTESSIEVLSISEQDEYELLTNKFDINTLVPFESQVLVRNVDGDLWKPAIYGLTHSKGGCYVVGGVYWYQCIPYKGNEYLRGKTDDCKEYYKTWK